MFAKTKTRKRRSKGRVAVQKDAMIDRKMEGRKMKEKKMREDYSRAAL
jgi:hypothetical protein